MKKFYILIFLLSIHFITICQTLQTGKIVKVVDGDTFDFQDSTNTIIRVRLNGIDCPEKKQLFGNEATKFMMKYLNNNCTIKTYNYDRYGRIIADLFINGININYELVKQGLAWHYKKYSSDSNLSEFEIEAKVKKNGLWSEPNPTEPWVWRKIKKH